nr:uncharacterized protein LOC112797188 isoform X1 [Arachis hypogaea]
MPLSFISSLPLIHSLQLISPLQETLLLLPSASFRSGSRSGLNLKVCGCRLFHCHCSSPRCHSSPHYIKQHRVATFNEVLASIRRAFYDDLTNKGDNQPKSGRSDNRGITVVILDALTSRCSTSNKRGRRKGQAVHTLLLLSRLCTCPSLLAFSSINLFY